MASISKRTRKNSKGESVSHWRAQDIVNGKRVEFTAKTKRLVEEKLRQYINDIEQYGSVLDKDEYSLSEWVHIFLYTKSYPTVAKSTFHRQQASYKHISTSSLGSVTLQNISPRLIQKFINSLELSNSSLRQIRILLNQSFEYAIDNNLLRTNPMRGVIVPKKNKDNTIRVLSKEQQKNYILALENEPNRLLFLTALFTGLRCGELIALKWKNVDLEKSTLFVCETVVRTKVYTSTGKSHFETVTNQPKTQSSIRTVPLPEFLTQELSVYKPSGTNISEQYVFGTSIGTPQWDCNIRNWHYRVCQKAQINPTISIENGNQVVKYIGVPFHALRHTFATRMIEAGENVKVIQELLGHSDIQTTLNIYTHVLEETKIASAKKQHNLYYDLLSL
ncbi:tyrosine-type recombinase/integrase [Zhenhengia yiwuensis]|uniref:Site-specific integrase n=1 Tax=Zhenhengia yiwuensis TaxID=2763666 RepID=A0A926I9W7_9FIRM|nr:site-specific integrase [Zhenhengia yiwuensis]MBC8580220.1 site-specific integrase [Zhenhengia yiwuensis]